MNIVVVAGKVLPETLVAKREKWLFADFFLEPFPLVQALVYIEIAHRRETRKVTGK